LKTPTAQWNSLAGTLSSIDRLVGLWLFKKVAYVSVSLISGVPHDIAVERDGGRHSTLTPIAITGAGTVLSVECNCTPKTFQGFSFHELSFDIARFSGTEVFSIQNRLVARKMIPEGGVHLVLSLVIASYTQLIQTVKPDYIYRCSAFTGLHEPPLRKHRYISEAVQLCGYGLSETGRDRAGRSFWLHERATGRPAALFDISRGHGKPETEAIDPKKASIVGYFSDSVHGEMRMLGADAAAKHQVRVKAALRNYALDASYRETQRPAAA
jgi:hypothetical protein